MALGAVDAVRAAARDDIVIVGFGGTPDALAAIEAGTLTATIAQLPNRIGTLSVDALVRHLNGDLVSPRIDPGHVLVTADNVGQFIEQPSA
jgi:ribose transport system substrate-binding protein